jgi:DNA repair protein RecO (recombination protein O)
MTESASGIILRLRPLTETSLIVHWLTAGAGRVATVAKGARRPKSAFRGKLDLFYAADFSYTRSRRSDLHALREVSLRDTHGALRHDLGWLQQAGYCALLIEQTTETETPLEGVFELLRGFLRQLPLQPPQPAAIFAFEMKLLAELGQAPELADTRLTPGAQKILGEFVVRDWPALLRLKLSEPQVHEIQQFLHGFLIWHLGRIPAGRTAALGGG